MRRPSSAPRRSRSAEAERALRPSGRLASAAVGTSVVWALGMAFAPSTAAASPPEAPPAATGATDTGEAAAPAVPAPAEAPSPAPATDQPEGPTSGESEDPSPGTADDEGDGDPLVATEPDAAAASTPEIPRPPRVDGAFVGGALGLGMTFTRVNDLSTPSPMIGPVGIVSAGDAVFPWLTIGISFYGGGGFSGDQRVSHGGLLLDVGLLPAPKRAPFSFRLGAGFGAGAVRDANETARFGFGGALFRGGVRYEFFPTAAKRRPNRGGGWSIGPELTWLGETPAAAGRPMANTILLGLWTGFYFGS